MLIPLLLMTLFFCTNNAKHAQLRGLSTVKWVLLTLVLSFVGLFVASFVLIIILMVKFPGLVTLAQNQDREAINKFLMEQITQHDFVYPSLLMCGAFGGYLLIRYILEKKPLLPN